jgi:hypothetical protein
VTAAWYVSLQVSEVQTSVKAAQAVVKDVRKLFSDASKQAKEERAAAAATQPKKAAAKRASKPK